MLHDQGEVTFLDSLQKNYAAGRVLVRQSRLTKGLGDVQAGDLWAEIVAASPGLPAELAALASDAQRVRIDAELAALKKHDGDAFSGSFSPSYLVTVWRCLGLITADHMLYAADAMDADLRRREIRRCRRLLRETGKEIPAYDPSDYPLANPRARAAAKIEAARLIASRPFAAKPAGTDGIIAGPSRQIQSKELQGS